MCISLVCITIFFDIKWAIAGDLLRAEQNTPGSPYGQLIKEYIKEGNIVPFHITIALLHKAMSESGNENRFLIDGFPRAMDQAEKFEEEVIVLLHPQQM